MIAIEIHNENTTKRKTQVNELKKRLFASHLIDRQSSLLIFNFSLLFLWLFSDRFCGQLACLSFDCLFFFISVSFSHEYNFSFSCFFHLARYENGRLMRKNMTHSFFAHNIIIRLHLFCSLQICMALHLC